MTLNLQDYLPDLPEPEGNPDAGAVSYTCDVCRDIGWIKDREGDTKLIPCDAPACEKGRAAQQQVQENRFRDTEIPEEYQAIRLATWAEGMHKPGGKYLAWCAIEIFIENDCRVASSAIARRFLTQFPGIADALTPEQREALQAVAASAPVWRAGLALWGEHGTGKTWLGVALLNALREDGQSVRFLRLQDALQALTATWRKDSTESTGVLIERYQDVPVLMLDEFSLGSGRKQPHEWQYEFVESIMRIRARQQLATILTTNLSPDDMDRYWSGKIAESVREMCEWVQVGGEKIRHTRQDIARLSI